MNRTIREHIARCFAEESREAARAEAFAMLADKEGRRDLARLFRVLARASGVRAKRFGHLMRGKIGTTEENLQEVRETVNRRAEAYGGMIGDVKSTEASGAVRKGFIQSRRSLMEGLDLLADAEQGEGPDTGADLFVCTICGHIHTGAIPESCPVCGAVPGRFEHVP